MFVTALTILGVAFAIATGVEARRQNQFIVRRPWRRGI